MNTASNILATGFLIICAFLTFRVVWDLRRAKDEFSSFVRLIGFMFGAILAFGAASCIVDLLK